MLSKAAGFEPSKVLIVILIPLKYVKCVKKSGKSSIGLAVLLLQTQILAWLKYSISIKNWHKTAFILVVQCDLENHFSIITYTVSKL